jgi:hypothetical protein
MVRIDEAFGLGVVVGVSTPAHRADEPMLCEQLAVSLAEPLVPHIFGTIDRVTGYVDATWGSTDYALKCTPTQRMF